MKKVVLSALAATIVTSAVYAESMTLFSDPKTGQVFTTAGDGRVEMGDFVSAKEVDMGDREQASLLAEYQDAEKDSVTVINSKSPTFILGKETGPNMKIKAKDNKDMYIKLGVRLQSTFENRTKDYALTTKDSLETNDAYMRRTRLEVEAGFDKHTSFVMDLRNDNVNSEDKGEQTFNVGDAYLDVKKPFDTSLVNFKFFRGKIDVSRSETAKSAYNVHYDRAHIADEAAQYITHNRRGTNAQMYGDWEKKVHYQIAAGDGVYSGAFKDAKGVTLNDSTKVKGSVVSQNFFYGGKIKLSPFDGWEEQLVTETYMGQGQHFTVGAAYWKTGNIKTTQTVPGTVNTEVDHELVNLEASAHYKGASVTAEYFAFDGVVKDWTATGAKTIGKSTGWYAQGEYVFTDLGYIAPFYRYESWDRFKDAAAGENFDLTSRIAGVNWYLRGNTTKVGFSVQNDSYGKTLGDYTDTRFKLTSQFHF